MALSFFEGFVAAMMLSTGHTSELPASQVSCLTEAIFFEAGNQSLKGKTAVGHTIMNRSKSNKYPTNVCYIVGDKTQYHYHQRKKRFKFDPDNKRLVKQIEDSARAALKVTSRERKVPDLTLGATHFINPKIATDVHWVPAFNRTALIGDHLFLKERKKQGR